MTRIATRPLGPTGLRVSEIGVGTATLGNLYAPMADTMARATLDAALAAGLHHVDTAPHYGFGLSERRVGDAVRGRRDVVLSTKVGRLLVPDASLDGNGERLGFRSPMPFRPAFDYSYDGILRSHEASLQRLGLARIDIVYIHDIGRLTHGADQAARWDELTRGGGLRALETLRSSGAIQAFGIGVNEIAVCMDVMREVRLDAILLAGRYTLLEQDALDDLLPACAAAGTSIVVGGPYNSGILATGTGGRTPHYDYAPAPTAVVARVAAIEAVAVRHGVTLAAAALQFPLAHRQVASVIPGLASPAQVAQTVALHGEAIPTDFWLELKHLRLIRRRCALPRGCCMSEVLRIGSVIGIHPDRIAEYKRLHAAIWPQVAATIAACNIRNYTIFLREPENLLFACYDYHGTDHAADLARLAEDAATREWWALCGPMQAPLETRARGEWWAAMVPVFHQD